MSKQFEYNLRNKFFTDTKELAYVGKVDDQDDVIWSSNYVKHLESLVKNNVVLDFVSYRRELLINYNEHLQAEYHYANYDESDVDEFLNID